MLTKEQISRDFCYITKNYKNLCSDISITSPSKETRYLKVFEPKCKQDITDEIKSVIVWSVFSDVAGDYFFQRVIFKEIHQYLSKKYSSMGINFLADNYLIDRKQYALRSGVGKLSKPSIVFHKDYGLNCKFELLFCDHEIEGMTTIEDTILYENCIECPAPCEKNCPQGCKMNYDLVDWEKCANLIGTDDVWKNPEKMCRLCQSSCPFSEELRLKVKQKNKRYGDYLEPKFFHLNKMNDLQYW